jgi:hypothetical protein
LRLPSRATRDLLKSFGWGIAALHRLDPSDEVARRPPYSILWFRISGKRFFYTTSEPQTGRSSHPVLTTDNIHAGSPSLQKLKRSTIEPGVSRSVRRCRNWNMPVETAFTGLHMRGRTYCPGAAIALISRECRLIDSGPRRMANRLTLPKGGNSVRSA